jgi:hypothetical protein
LQAFERHLIKQNGEHDLCHVCQHILEGSIAKGVFSSSTSSLSAESESSFTSKMKSLKSQLSKSGLQTPSYFTDDFTNPSASSSSLSSGVDYLTNPFNTNIDGIDKNNTELIGNGVNKIKSYKQNKRSKEQRNVKKVKKEKVEVVDAHCAHDGNCDVCYNCRKCKEKSRDTKNKTNEDTQRSQKTNNTMKNTRKECKLCASLHKVYCSM